MLPAEVRETFVKMGIDDNYPPAVFKFFSKPNGATATGAVMLVLASYWSFDAGPTGVYVGVGRGLACLGLFLIVSAFLAGKFTAQLVYDLQDRTSHFGDVRTK